MTHDLFNKKKPFKLCFVAQVPTGKSSIQVGKPLKLPCVISPKFYSKDCVNYEITKDDLSKFEAYLDVKGPREKYGAALTENQSYGWYQVQFTDLDKLDRRLHFAKHTNPLVREHLMNYAKIR